MKFKNLSDEEVVAIVRNKDKEVYAEIVSRYEKMLTRYANYLVDDREVAADVVQNAFVKAFVNLQSFNLQKKFSSWIYRIVHNEAINELKKDRKKISLEANAWLHFQLTSDQNVEKEFEKEETTRQIKKTLKKLPANYRSVLSLYYLEEKSYEEIGDILKIPLGTVGSWISRAKTKMKKVLKNE